MAHTTVSPGAAFEPAGLPLSDAIVRRLAGVKPYVLVGQLFIVIGTLTMFGAIQGQIVLDDTLFLGFGAIGCAVPLLAPRESVRHVFVSLPLLLLYAYLVCSVAWVSSFMPYRAAFQQQVPMVIAGVFVASILPFDKIVQALKAAFIAGMLLSFFAVLVDPAARIHDLEDGTMFTGWRGSFEHKNGLVPFVLLAVMTFILFERRRWLRLAVFASAAVLIIGSQSATGLSCAIVLGGAAWWLRSYLKQDLRLSGSYVALSLFGAVVMAIAISLLLPWIVNLYGKDLTFTNRTEIWSTSVDAIGDSPWIGYGWNGVWIDEDVEPTVSMNREIGFVAGHAHNSVLEMLLEGGVIGLALYAVFWGSVAVAAWRALRTHPDIARWVLLFLTAQAVVGVSEVTLYHGWIFTLVLMRGILAQQLSTTTRARS
ncbi:MAG TPA: O-antigen ligase family protein [Acidimicrobiales bacterium]